MMQKLKSIKVDSYFLTEKNPFTKKRDLKTKPLLWTGGILCGGFVVAVLFLGEATQETKKSEDSSSASTNASTSPDGATAPHSQSSSESWWIENRYGGMGSQGLGGSMGGSGSARQYTASQLVKSDSSGGNGFALPISSTIPAKLLNTVISSDSSQPVIALITDTVTWKNSTLIPEGTKAIGSASFDDTAERLQVRFHTLVYPEGDQHSVSGIALLADGSSGLEGDYHSGKTKKQVARFFGNFVGGLAEGMKEKETAGKAGIPFEQGSIKNGLLNGAANSTLDYAKSVTEDMENVRSYLKVDGGTEFYIYLEREYSL